MRVMPPIRARHTYTQRLIAPPEQVFPLLCPVREVEWVNGWEPRVVYSASGVAELYAVFVVPSGDGESIWTVTRYEPETHAVGFVKVTPGETVCVVEIDLERDGEHGTAATVSYSYTALSPRGERVVAEFTVEAYGRFMLEWEADLNHFLETGTRRP